MDMKLIHSRDTRPGSVKDELIEAALDYQCIVFTAEQQGIKGFYP